MKINFQDYVLGNSLYYYNNSSHENVVYFDGMVYYGVAYFNNVWRFIETSSYQYGIEYRNWQHRVTVLREFCPANKLFPITTLPSDVLQDVKQAKKSGDKKYADLLRKKV